MTNDDGILAPGLRALRRRLKSLGQVTVVAPESEQSAAGHSITLLHPLIAQEVHEEGEFVGFAVDGKPADCVKLGLVALLAEPPDLVVSGINSGSNAGINVLYSGTVAAAIEGSFYDITSIAVSLQMNAAAADDPYERAAEIAERVIRQITSHDPKPGDLFNVNIPDLTHRDPVGVRVAPQGLVAYRENYEARLDPRGRRYHWLLPDVLRPGDAPDSDLKALSESYVSVTPLHFDLTHARRLEEMRRWKWDL